MSGRKQSEVAAVLRQGEQARSITDDIIRDYIESRVKIIARAGAKIKGIINNVRNISASISADAKNIFKEKATSLQNDFNDVKSSVINEEVNNKRVNEISNEFTALSNEIKQCDNEAERIREAIKNKYSGYCDKEYSDAKKLVKRYKKIRKNMEDLQTEIGNISRDTENIVNRVNIQNSQLDDLNNQINNMNATAKLNKESKALKEKIFVEFDKIDVKMAEKFSRQEYEKISDEVARLKIMTDSEVVSHGGELYGIISNYTNELNNRIAIFKQQKMEAEVLRDEISKMEEETFIEPISYQNNSEIRIPLFDYVQQYAGSDIKIVYDKYMVEGSDLMEQENFTAAIEVLKKADMHIKDARSQAINLQERMLKNVGLAVAVAKVMHGMHYNIHTDVIDGNPNNGFRVICSYGDEIIDFDKINYDGDGNPIVSIEHQESIGGTCGNSWKDIQANMVHAGIPLTDVKKNGNSVLYSKYSFNENEVTGVRERG